MADITIDASGNIPLGPGGSLPTVSKSAAVKQSLRIRLRTFLGEWFRDRNEGVDYRNEILIHDFKSSRADREIRRCIMLTPGIQSIVSIEINPDPHTQIAHFRIRYRDIYGTTDQIEAQTP
jgi:hypothetical protein